MISALPDGLGLPSEAYWIAWFWVCALPVLPVSWSFTHWMELSPVWEDSAY